MCLQPQTNEGDTKRQARKLGGGVEGGRRKATTQQQAFKLTFSRSLRCTSLAKLSEPDHMRIVSTSGAFMSYMNLPEVKRNPSTPHDDLTIIYVSLYV